MATLGNILSPTLNSQVQAIKVTARLIDETQLKLASGQSVNTALDNPENFFTAITLENRSSDLAGRLDGIGQSLRAIGVASLGVEASLGLIDQAEGVAQELEKRFLNGEPAPVASTTIAVDVANVLASNPNAIHLGGGVIVQSYTSTGTVTFVPPSGVDEVEYLIVGGGGGGGTSTTFGTAGSGGGGAGGVLTGSLDVINTSYDVIVGQGGVNGSGGNNSGANGGDSSFGVNVGENLIALGGGGGVGGNGNGADGGSGGGGRGGTGGVGLQSGTAQSGQGNNGGTGSSSGGFGGGGGGGALSAGGNHSSTNGGGGGAGIESLITGSSLLVGGGGGGGGANSDGVGSGGVGGGGRGANDGSAATAGEDNTGGGGGGGNNNRLGASGGSGVVILRYTITDTDQPSTENAEYSKLLDQLDLLTLDAHYRGINLLRGEQLTTFFNEDASSYLTTKGRDVSRTGLGLKKDNLTTLGGVQESLEQLADARQTLRTFSSTLTNDLNVIQVRQKFTQNLINTLDAGADDLTVADQNELGANLLALQTRQQIQFSVLNFGVQFQNSVVDLVG